MGTSCVLIATGVVLFSSRPPDFGRVEPANIQNEVDGESETHTPTPSGESNTTRGPRRAHAPTEAVDPDSHRRIPISGPASGEAPESAEVWGYVRTGNRALTDVHVSWLVSKSLSPTHPVLAKKVAQHERTKLLSALRLGGVTPPTTSDEDGRYDLPGIPVGSQVLLVFTPATGLPRGFTYDASIPGRHRLDVDLAASQRIEGRVRCDDTGRPLAAVEVSGGVQLSGNRALTTTDDRGVFSFSHSDGTFAIPSQFTFRKEGYLPLTIGRIPPDGPIEMTPAVQILGALTDPDNRPVKGMGIAAELESPYAKTPWVPYIDRGVTDDRGRFALRIARRAGMVRLQATHPSTTIKLDLGVYEVPGMGDLVVHPVMPHTGRIEGVVAVGRLPTRATVHWSLGEQLSGETRTEKDGTFALDHVPVGVVDIQASVVHPHRTTDTRALVVKGTTTRARLDFPAPPGILAGRVLTASGNAVEQRTVHAEGRDGSLYRGTTRVDGSFAIDVPVDPSIDYQVWLKDQEKRRIQFGIRAGREGLLFVVDA